jgi:hypothetical protein
MDLIGHQLHRLVRVTRVHSGSAQIAGDVSPRHAEVARRGEQVAGTARIAQVHADLGVGWTGGATIVGGEPDREAAIGEQVHDSR